MSKSANETAAESDHREPRTLEESLLAVRDLDAGYGDLQVLTDVLLNVEEDEYVTLVGPNGAGKSTVMKSVFGLATHMGGSVAFDGTTIHGRKPEEIIHEGIGYVPKTRTSSRGCRSGRT